METNYLNDSSTNGNVLKGFEGFLTTHKATSCALAPRTAPRRVALPPCCAYLPPRHAALPRRLKRARNFKTEDRLFSLSSSTSPAVEELEQERLGARPSSCRRLGVPITLRFPLAHPPRPPARLLLRTQAATTTRGHALSSPAPRGHRPPARAQPTATSTSAPWRAARTSP